MLGQGYYWWEAGAMWGALVDYWAYTGDETYVQKTINALVAQGGSKRDLLNPKYFSSTVRQIMIPCKGTTDSSPRATMTKPSGLLP